ncbi:MAG: hypothetical protein JST39_11440 [Bacteroidetes bacterium]|nr:hypothetical protein [Bacteroidota bacterium]
MEICADRLLPVYLELKHRTILTGVTWTGDEGDNSSIAIIYRQFIALCEGMGLDLKGDTPEDKIASFEDGYFIKKRPLEKYSALLGELEAFEPMLSDYAFWKNDSFQFRYRQIKGLFIGLISFKLKTDFRFYGPLEGLATGSKYAHELRIEALDRKVVSKIDQILSHIIDPDQHVFDQQTLAEKHGYPETDYETRYREERINEEF